MPQSDVTSPDVQLRAVVQADLPIFFVQQQDPAANHMAAFTAPDPNNEAAFMARWQRILADDNIITRTILADDAVAGHILQFEHFQQPSVSYWLGRAYWQRGIATAALRLFLQEIALRPLYARAAKDNQASIRVLEKCGFRIIGEDTGFANARGTDIAEVILRLS